MTPFDFRKRRVCGLKSKKDKESRGVANLKEKSMLSAVHSRTRILALQALTFAKVPLMFRHYILFEYICKYMSSIAVLMM